MLLVNGLRSMLLVGRLRPVVLVVRLRSMLLVVRLRPVVLVVRLRSMVLMSMLRPMVLVSMLRPVMLVTVLVRPVLVTVLVRPVLVTVLRCRMRGPVRVILLAVRDTQRDHGAGLRASHRADLLRTIGIVGEADTDAEGGQPHDHGGYDCCALKLAHGLTLSHLGVKPWIGYSV
ncbi:hypothetical protein AQI88_03710 [Streptomyces cellostaticus]|uniref:Uncharacterized protein n=1 Tax=Streptomyces cellostaticus TaxID=67285 RepID=A0A101NRX4_9ACTN|nr:hypothetical protein AQI88_03710 [Streptomyces cellostaticus]